MTEILLVLFDLNGVLFEYERAARIDALAAISGCRADRIETAIWGSGFEDAGDAGGLDAQGYLQGFGAAIGFDLSEGDWVAALRASITPIPAALALLGRIRPGVACAVLTNNNMLVRKHFSTLYPEVAARVGERAYVSAEFNASKPDPAVYQSCLMRLGIAPSATLFVDDNAANVSGAAAAGLEGYHSIGPDDLAAELSRRKLLD